MKKLILIFILSLLPSLAFAQTSRNPCVYITQPNCLAVGYYLAGATGAPMPVGGIANASAPTFTEAKPGYLSFDLSGNLRVISASTGGTTVVVGNVSNASSGVATTSTNVGTNAYNYGFNGIGWDQLQVDANKYLKVVQAGLQSDPCQAVAKTYTPISITTATTTRIVAPASSKKTYICYLLLTSAAADNVGIVEGTGGTCGSGTAGVIGGTTSTNGPNFAANGGMSIGNGGYAVAATAGTNVDLCLITSAATPLAGHIAWVQQ